MSIYRGGLGKVRSGRRQGEYSKGPEGLAPQQGGTAWDYATEMLNRGFDAWDQIGEERMARKRAEEERARLQLAKAEQEQRDAQEEIATQEMNQGLFALQQERLQPGYVPPEGEVKGEAGPEFAPTLDDQAKIAGQMAEAQLDAAEQTFELTQKALEESTAVEKKEAVLQTQAESAVNSLLKAEEARDARLRNMQEVEARRAAGQDVSAEIAALRQEAATDKIVTKAKAKLEDDVALYEKHLARVKKEVKENGGLFPGVDQKLSKRQTEALIEAETRKRMDIERINSGLFRQDEDGSLVFDEERARRIAANVVASKLPPVKPGASYSDEDWAYANRVNYNIPAKMLDWKPGAWEAMGLDPETALKMATHAAQQRARVARREPVQTAGGANVAPDPASSLGGISGSQGPSVRPADLARSEDEDEEGAEVNQFLGSAAQTVADPRDQPAPGPGGVAAPPPSPAPTPPAPAAPPAAAAPPAPAQAPTDEQLAATGGDRQTYLDYIYEADNSKRPTAQQLADQSNLEKELEATFIEQAQEAVSMLGEGGVYQGPGGEQGLGSARAHFDKVEREAKAKAEKVADLTKQIADLDSKDWSPEAKANKAAELTKALNRERYGHVIANDIEAVTQEVVRKVKAGQLTEAEAQDYYTERLTRMVQLRKQEARSGKLDARAAMNAAAWDSLEKTLGTGEGAAQFALTTGLPLAIAALSGGAGIGLLGRAALVAFTAGGVQLAQEGGILDENGKIDWERIRSAGIEGVTSVIEVPVADKMLDLVKSKAGKSLFKRFISTGGGALLEGMEEPFQQTLSSLLNEGKLPSMAELKVAATLGSLMGGAMTGTMSAFIRNAGDPKKGGEILTQALELIKRENPQLFNDAFLETMDEGELAQVLSDMAPEIDAAIAQNEAGMTDAELEQAFNEELAAQAAYPYGPVSEADVDVEAELAKAQEQGTDETVEAKAQRQALEEAQAAAAKRAEQAKQTKPKKFEEAEDGDLVEGPREFAGLTAEGTQWRKAGKDSYRTTLGGQTLEVQVGVDGLTMKAGKAGVAGVDPDSDVNLAGEFVPDTQVSIGKGDLIKIATGKGRTTAAHELLHFMRKNGLVGNRDWATLRTRYAKEIMAYAKSAYGISGQKAWNDLSPEWQERLVEEGIAESMGTYARARFGEGTVKVPKALEKIFNFVRDIGMKVTGKTDAEFDKLLRSEFEKGDTAPATEASPRVDEDYRAHLPGKGVSPVGALPISAPAGWQGIRNPRTGTIGLQGPQGQKIGAKVDGKTLGVKTIGKGKGESSREVVSAIREFAKQRKLNSIVMTSKPGEITPAAYKWRERMMERGDARYTQDGKFEIALEPGGFKGEVGPVSLPRIDNVTKKRKQREPDPRRSKKQVIAVINEDRQDLSSLPEEQQVRLMATQLTKEIKYQRQQVKSGAGWYRGDIRELEHAAKKRFPELENPEMMGLFKAVAAASSFGNKPNPNIEQAFEIWRGFTDAMQESFPAKQTSGKHWPGSPTFAVSQEKLTALKEKFGSWEGVVRFFMSQHTVKDLNALGLPGRVTGKMGDLAWGSRVLGPKGNAFFQNLVGNLGELTADVWWTRTFNRVRGTDVTPEAPRNDSERALMRKVIREVSRRTGVSEADAQAMLWFAEQDLWTKLGLKSQSGSYAVAGRRALESQRAGKATAPGYSASAAVKPRSESIAWEVAFSPNSKLRKELNWDSLTPEQQKQVSDAVMDKILPAVASDTGVEIERDVRSWATTEQWGTNPNAVVRVTGTPGQVRQAAMLLGLATQQDSVVVSRPSKAGDPVPAVRVRSGINVTSKETMGQVLDALIAIAPDANIGGLAVDVAGNGTPIIKAFAKDFGAAFDVKRVATALGQAVAQVSPDAKVSTSTQAYETEFIENNWKEEPNGEGYRDALDEQGYSPEFLDDFQARTESAVREAWPGRTPEPPTARPRVERGSAAKDTWRRMSKPILDRMREVKTKDGREVGAMLAEKVSDRQEFIERKLSRLAHGYKKALRGFKIAEGDAWQAKWQEVAEVLDGQRSYKELDRPQQQMYQAARAIFNTAKHDAIEAGSFSGQQIFRYFPHMRTDIGEIDPVQDHLDYLLENDPDRLETLREEDWTWMSGILGDASDYELAAKDLARNWKSEKWWKSNPHLEKHRGATSGEYRMDTDVLLDYLNSVYPRIATARYFGEKSEVIDNSMRALKSSNPDDYDFIYDSLQTTLGFGKGPKTILGRGASRLGREIAALSGIVKLANAAIPQLTQVAVAGSEATTRGFVPAAKNVARAAGLILTNAEAMIDNAVRAGSTFAAEGLGRSEIQRAQFGLGEGTAVEAISRKLLGKKITASAWGVVPMDKFARVAADTIGREFYLDALRAGDRVALLDLLGTKELVDLALERDAPRVDELTKKFRQGKLDETVFTQDVARPAEGDPVYVGKQLGLGEGIDLMDRAAKRFSDKTQYRTRAQDAPLGFQHPMVRWANTFLSFMYQHWRWQANHFKAMTASAKSDPAKARRHARALIAQNLVLGPMLGTIAYSVRALLTGRGQEEEEEYGTPMEAFDAVMGVDPIAMKDELGVALRYLQGWQYAGGIGYPMTILERWRRGTQKENTYRGVVSAVAGAPGESVFDAGATLIEIGKYADKASDGRATTADRKAVKRALINLTNHIVPNPFGLAGGARRELQATEDYPNDSPGWLGFVWDPEARWTVEEGVTSPTYEAAKEEKRLTRQEKREREREKAEEDALDREGFWE